MSNLSPDARRLLLRIQLAGKRGLPAVTGVTDARVVDDLATAGLVRWDGARWHVTAPEHNDDYGKRYSIVELTDESDDLIGYGVCRIDEGFTMLPDVHATRSSAHSHAASLYNAQVKP